MPTRHRRKSRFSFLVLPLILVSVALYFGWQSTRGDYGQESREALRLERMDRTTELAELVDRRRVLQERVRSLRTDALDADLLDERARAQLNMAHSNELVILHRRADDVAPSLAAHGR